VQVGVAQARRLDINEHFPADGLVNLNVFDVESATE
jgi:hypothetical protein